MRDLTHQAIASKAEATLARQEAKNEILSMQKALNHAIDQLQVIIPTAVNWY
jgi:hypothetical protein